MIFRRKTDQPVNTTAWTHGRATSRASLVGSTISALLMAVSLGCGSGASQARSPAETLRNYADALDEGRIEDAYAMLSDEARLDMSLETFRRMTKENPKEMHEVAMALRRPASAPVVTVSMETPDGDPLVLRYESGRWRIDASAIDLYSQATPRHAVVAFVRAFENGRYDVLMRFVPDEKKAGLDAAKLKSELCHGKVRSIFFQDFVKG